MKLVSHLLIALVLVFQSLPGLGAAQCAAMSGGGDLSEVVSAQRPSGCPCCSGLAQTSSSCEPRGTAGACCCGEPRPEVPQTPPGDSKNKVLEQLLVYLPAAASALQFEPMPTVTVSFPCERLSHRAANSIQSLLCVWVM